MYTHSYVLPKTHSRTKQITLQRKNFRGRLITSLPLEQQIMAEWIFCTYISQLYPVVMTIGEITTEVKGHLTGVNVAFQFVHF